MQKFIAIAAAAASFAASPVFAQQVGEQHYVFIEAEGYFPQTTYADPGDTVRFINSSDKVHQVMASDGTWATEALSPSGEHVMVLEDGMRTAFNKSDDAEFNGSISFSDPDLD